MRPFLLSVVRVFYTVVLLLLALGDFVFWQVELAAQADGHGDFRNFLWSQMIFMLLFFLLLASRILSYRSPWWYLLGAPSALLLGVPIVFLVVDIFGGVVFGIGV
jgi:cell division protein FtsW (lipid II flippase)